ncbi:1,4-beta-D-glucan glucohydrolase [Massilia sp. KIM]|uniref:GDSL-type esterase/lipase family protein n=1 Tax=Massilia sp. KIM TaxID=1955422 RepID=UPI0009902DBF|nr:GDSL-type esterase/lipase family protein [Massilia sp. KIM]OON62816.1 1,4-beta-D-glucan glucohydrolase [Massilia sp. KIM]
MTHTPRALGAAFGTALTAALLAGCATPGLALYDSRPLDGYQVVAIDPDNEHPLTGQSLSIDAALQPKFPNSAISLARTGKQGADDALTLRWQNIWKSGLRLQGAPTDLRPYLDGGTLAFDLNVTELSKGGIAFKMGCGPGCERPVSYVLPGRAAQGKGWQHVELSLSCFYREGDDFSAVTRPFSLEGTGRGEVSVANVQIKRRGAPNTSCPDYRTVGVTPSPLNESWALDWWMPRHLKKLEDIKAMKAAGRSPQLVFIGDSITEGWEKEGASIWDRLYKRHDAIALGFGGDRTENVLWRLVNGEVDGIDPKLVVLMLGTNNTGQRQDIPALTAQGVKRNIEELRRRLPNSRILLLAIFPRDETPEGPLRRLNQQVNAILPGFADNRHVYYLDINQAFLQPDGRLPKEVMPDLLHPNEKGYEIWARAMQPELDRLMALPRP